MDHQGHAPKFQHVRSFTLLLLQQDGDHRPLGKQWIQQFKRRNPDVASLFGRSIEMKRMLACTPDTLNKFNDLITVL